MGGPCDDGTPNRRKNLQVPSFLHFGLIGFIFSLKRAGAKRKLHW
jgi:hypothetical protein